MEIQALRIFSCKWGIKFKRKINLNTERWLLDSERGWGIKGVKGSKCGYYLAANDKIIIGKMNCGECERSFCY